MFALFTANDCFLFVSCVGTKSGKLKWIESKWLNRNGHEYSKLFHSKLFKRLLQKQTFASILQNRPNPHENMWWTLFNTVKLQPSSMQLHSRRDSGTGIFFWSSSVAANSVSKSFSSASISLPKTAKIPIMPSSARSSSLFEAILKDRSAR